MIRHILFFLFIAISFSASAYICDESSKEQCRFYIDKTGALHDKNDNKDTILSNNIDDDAATYDSYVIKRTSGYYLVRESFTNLKSYLIVPLLSRDGTCQYNRVIYFSINTVKSSKAQLPVWEGFEYILTNNADISNVTPDRFRTKITKHFNLESSSAETTNNDSHFISAQAYSEEDNNITSKIYYSPHVSFRDISVDQVSCVTSCSSHNANDIEEHFFGNIGNNVNIEIKLAREGNEVHGSYRYIKHNKWIRLAGTLSNGSIVMEEFWDGEKNGEFSGVIENNSIYGTWVSPSKDKTLTFYAVKDSL